MKFRTERFYRPIFPELGSIFFGHFLLLLSFVLVPNCLEATAQIEEVSQLNSKEEFQLRGKLRIAVKDNLPPLAFRNQTGNLVGFEIDLAKEIAKELLGDSNAVEFVVVTNQQRIPFLVENKVDLAIAQISVTSNRGRLADFSLPYYRDRTVLIASRKLPIKDELSKIVVLKNSTAIAAIKSGYPNAEIIGASSYMQAIAALENDQVQAIAGDYLALSSWLQANPQYFLIGQPLDFHSLAIAIPKGLQHKRLFLGTIEVVNKLRQNGWLNQKATEWKLPISP